MVSARAVAAAVVDPEMPMLTLDDLGVLRDVRAVGDAVTVTITPTYSGCPALETMRDDLRAALAAAGFGRVEVRTVLSPPWSTDWISDAGRAKLAEHGIAPPDRVGPRRRRADPADPRQAARRACRARAADRRHRGAVALRPHRLHRAAPLHASAASRSST